MNALLASSEPAAYATAIRMARRRTRGSTAERHVDCGRCRRGARRCSSATIVVRRTRRAWPGAAAQSRGARRHRLHSPIAESSARGFAARAVARTDRPEREARAACRASSARLRATSQHGVSSPTALARLPAQFDALYCQLVAVGEAAGALPPVLARLADERERAAAQRAKVRAALTYPVAVLLLALAITAALLIWVVPTFKQIFDGFGAELARRRRASCIALSDAVARWSVPGSIAIAAVRWHCAWLTCCGARRLRVSALHRIALPLAGRGHTVRRARGRALEPRARHAAGRRHAARRCIRLAHPGDRQCRVRSCHRRDRGAPSAAANGSPLRCGRSAAFRPSRATDRRRRGVRRARHYAARRSLAQRRKSTKGSARWQASAEPLVDHRARVRSSVASSSRCICPSSTRQRGVASSRIQSSAIAAASYPCQPKSFSAPMFTHRHAIGVAIGSLPTVVAIRVCDRLRARDRQLSERRRVSAAHHARARVAHRGERSGGRAARKDDGLPARYNLCVPRSACPHCGHVLRMWENIPLLSYLLLRGRCSACRTPVRIRYPLVELASAALAALTLVRFGPTRHGSRGVRAMRRPTRYERHRHRNPPSARLADAAAALGRSHRQFRRYVRQLARRRRRARSRGTRSSGASIGSSSWFAASKAWGTATSSCSPRSAPGSVGLRCRRSSSLRP